MNDFSPVAAAAFLGDPVHDAILARVATSVDDPKFAAVYLEAVGKCPEVIRQESPHAMFLAFCNYNVSLAASRLASFWSVRKEVFGPIEAFMPTVHALTEEEKAKIAQGSGVILPPKKDHRLVFFWERSRMAQKWSSGNKSVFKAFYFIMHSLSLELYDHHRSSSGTFEAIHVTLLQPQGGTGASTSLSHLPLTPLPTSTKDLRTRIIRDALCLRFTEMHAVAIVEEIASKRVLVETVVPITMETIREVLCVQEPVTLHCKATVQDVLTSLETNGFSAESLPASVGGTWSYEAEWRPWLQKKGILPAPILLKPPPPTRGSNISALPLASTSESYAERLNDGTSTQSGVGSSRPAALKGISPFASARPIPKGPPSAVSPFASAPKHIPKRPPQIVGVDPLTIAPRPIPTGPPGNIPLASAPRPIPTGPLPGNAFTAAQPTAGPLAGLARIMRQPPAAAPPIVTPGSTPDPLSQLRQLGPTPPPVRRGKPLGLAGLGLLRSLPACRKVTTPEPSHRVHDAMASLPDFLTAAYKEAMNRSPQLVKNDSPYEQFLAFCKGDPKCAARRLAMYWNLRRQIFGETDAFLPLSQALSMFDVSLLVSGDLGAFIAPGVKGQDKKPILYLHGAGDVKQTSVNAPSAGANPKLRVMWYLLQSVAELAGRNSSGEGFSSSAEAICICRLSPLTLAVFTDDVAEAVSSMIRDAMCVRFELHVAVPGAGTSPAAAASYSLSAFEQAIPVALEFLGEMVNCIASSPNSMAVHRCASLDQVCASLQSHVPTHLIPRACGGSWDLEVDWRSCLQNHSTLRGPLALVFMMIKPTTTKPRPGKRKFVAADVHRSLQQQADGFSRH